MVQALVTRAQSSTADDGRELNEHFEDSDEQRAIDDEFEELETGLGDKIVWEDTPVFQGTYTGQREVAVDASQSINGQAGTARPHTFTADNGDSMFAWNSPQLDYALDGLIGRYVRITHTGKEPIGRGRTVNTFRVQVRKQTT